ncbi:hypothetical protein [Iamia sp.]|uniref:hypothetical protein n=1 Tax=Iamia sp. TaxID=2722710 RepID=UPI002B82DB8E|nr:hypothetical protein [Iamia sp.]HXH57735.1 hypothetical protein [Iamia sp.]
MPSVIEWVAHLEAKIEKQRLYAAQFEARYRNDHVLPFIAREYREVYGDRVDAISPTLSPPRTGTAAIGIDALVERLTVTGVAAGDGDTAAVQLVQEAWEDNDLDVMHREAHRETFIKARSFAQVVRGADGRAVVGIEAPEQMAVHREQAPPYDVDAALKVKVDEWTGQPFARLELPGRSIDLEQGPSPILDPVGRKVFSRWVVVKETSTQLPGVPVVEFARQPRLLAEPTSEIERIATLVDIVDLVEGLMVFAGHFGAVPIRWATGLAVPRDPADPTGQTPMLGPNGKPIIGFNPRADHMFVSTEVGAKFGQLEPAGLASFVSWGEHCSKRVRAMTSVPGSYYGVGPQTHMSAELLKTDEAPMVRRVLSMGRDGSFGQAWRRVHRLILQIEDPTSKARLRPRWADPETRVEAQATDSFQKVVASGIGVRAAAEKILGWEPELVARAVAEAAAEEERVALMAEGLAAQAGAGFGSGSVGLVAV